MNGNKKFWLLILWGCVGLTLSAALGLMLGARFISPVEIISAVTGDAADGVAGVFYYSRLPRVIASLLAGAALSVAGAVLQNVLSNKLASPSIIGVNAGAGLGVTLCTALGFLSGWAVSLFAFGGSILAVLVLSLFAVRTGAAKTTVILGGVALNSILGALSESLCVLDNDVAMLTTEFRVGGFSAVSYLRLLPAGIMIILALAVILTLLNELEVIALGDETSKSVGLRSGKYRIVFLILAALLSGAAVSFSGLLGFVGLIVPHFVRRLVGASAKRLIPLSIIFGGAFVCLCDTLSRVIFMPYELPVGILMAVIGGPTFVIMLVNMKGGNKKCSI